MNKEKVVNVHNGILFSHKKKEILPFVKTGMKWQGIMLSEVSQREKDNYYMESLYAETKKKRAISQKQRIGWWLPGTRPGGMGRRVKIFSYMKNK